jgi:hypothetical protein
MDTRVGVKKVASFSRLDEALKGKILENDLKENIESHLAYLQDEFRRYFPDVVAENPIWKFVRNHFTTNVKSLPEDVQEEFLELKFDSTAKDNFQQITSENFWLKYLPVYSKTNEQALRVIIPFLSTYFCEAGFFALVAIKTKQYYKLDVGSDLRYALSSTLPRIQKLVTSKQPHCPHS